MGENPGMRHICVIGDVVQSRGVQERSRLQAQLQASLGRINRVRRKSLLSPCTITLGDEFQAVYRDANSLFSDFTMLMHDVYPVRVRFSVGIGELSTRINRQRAIGMDGPAFHAARAGLSDLKSTHFVFRIADAQGGIPPWVNLMLDLISHESSGWKKTRLSVFRALLEGSDAKAIAKENDVTGAAVYKSIKSGALWTVQAMLQEISRWVNARRNAA